MQFFAVFCCFLLFFVNLVSLYTYSLLAISIFYISLSSPPTEMARGVDLKFAGGGGVGGGFYDCVKKIISISRYILGGPI
jgi:hypothetical protein